MSMIDYVRNINKRIPGEMISIWGPAAAERAWRENCEMLQRAADAALLQEIQEISPTMPYQPADLPGI